MSQIYNQIRLIGKTVFKHTVKKFGESDEVTVFAKIMVDNFNFKSIIKA